MLRIMPGQTIFLPFSLSIIVPVTIWGLYLLFIPMCSNVMAHAETWKVPWVKNGTVRENILMDNPFDESRRACPCLLFKTQCLATIVGSKAALLVFHTISRNAQ